MEIHHRIIERSPGAVEFFFSEKIKEYIEDIFKNGPEHLEHFNSEKYKYVQIFKLDEGIASNPIKI
jgi:hypothetical protein